MKRQYEFFHWLPLSLPSQHWVTQLTILLSQSIANLMVRVWLKLILSTMAFVLLRLCILQALAYGLADVLLSSFQSTPSCEWRSRYTDAGVLFPTHS